MSKRELDEIEKMFKEFEEEFDSECQELDFN
jgi:hypothetical protein